MKGVEHALATYAWLDSAKVVGLGASYGGFSMNYLNGNAPKDMFCALVNHDGLFDMRSGYWSTEELFFMEKEFDGPPCAAAASDPESPYNVASPALKVAEWRTPTLVIQGDKDYRLVTSEAVWKSTNASGAPDNSSLSHFSAMTRPCRLRRAVANRHRHAIEQASRRWRGGRREDSARTRRKILISTQVRGDIDVHGAAAPGRRERAPLLPGREPPLPQPAELPRLARRGPRVVPAVDVSRHIH